MPSPLAPTDVTRSVAQARAGYDRIAGIYDLVAGASERPYRERARALLALGPGERVLEIGCGTGETLAHFAKVTGHAIGLDLSSGMLRQAKTRLDALGLRAQLVEGDAHALPFEDHSQDAVFMSFVLDLVESAQIPHFLSECRRVLRPSGRLALVTMSADGGNRAAMALYAWSHRIFPVLVDCRPIHLRAALEAGGFVVEKLEQSSMWGLGVAWALGRKPASTATR
jgi:ubiquinone/menaquinone biosynthesis C-methylase UbiE